MSRVSRDAILNERIYKPRATRTLYAPSSWWGLLGPHTCRFLKSAGAPPCGDAPEITMFLSRATCSQQLTGVEVSKSAPLLQDSTDSVENSLSRTLSRPELRHQNLPHLCPASYSASSCLSCFFTCSFLRAVSSFAKEGPSQVVPLGTPLKQSLNSQ